MTPTGVDLERSTTPLSGSATRDRFSGPLGDTRQLVGPYLVFVIVVLATIPWRSKTYYEGGADSVVLAKAALSLVALGFAMMVGRSRPPRDVAAAPVVFLALYLACTVLGGMAAGSFVPATVVAVRVAILGTIVVFLTRRYPGPDLLRALIAALATVGFVGAVSGIGSLAQGRLAGGIPTLHPNELASISALVLLWCVWRMVHGHDRPWHLVVIVVAVPILLATGSRTPLVALTVSGLVLVLHTKALRARTVASSLVLLPIVAWFVTSSPIATELLLRGQDASQLTTLSNRTIAWQAALSPKSSPWLEWVGGGLSMKKVEVPGQWWHEQILDSSWISALVQGGIIGLSLTLTWVVYSLARTRRSDDEFAAIQRAIIVYLAVRGLLESGLFDASTAFLVFFVTVLATPVHRRSTV